MVNLEAAERLAETVKWTDPDLLEENGELAVRLREALRFRAGWELAEEDRRRKDDR